MGQWVIQVSDVDLVATLMKTTYVICIYYILCINYDDTHILIIDYDYVALFYISNTLMQQIKVIINLSVYLNYG